MGELFSQILFTAAWISLHSDTVDCNAGQQQILCSVCSSQRCWIGGKPINLVYIDLTIEKVLELNFVFTNLSWATSLKEKWKRIASSASSFRLRIFVIFLRSSWSSWTFNFVEMEQDSILYLNTFNHVFDRNKECKNSSRGLGWYHDKIIVNQYASSI